MGKVGNTDFLGNLRKDVSGPSFLSLSSSLIQDFLTTGRTTILGKTLSGSQDSLGTTSQFSVSTKVGYCFITVEQTS